MPEPNANRRERSVAWQKRWVTPALLAILLLALIGVTVVGGISAWIGVVLIVFLAAALVTSLVTRRGD